MSDLVTVRYPSGGIESRTSDKARELGDVLKRNGDNWIVEEVGPSEDGTAVVTLRPGPKPLESEAAEPAASA